jgi:hypothetical protein
MKLPSLKGGQLVLASSAALVVGADAFCLNPCDQLVALATRHFLPAIYAVARVRVGGGLISGEANVTAPFRQAVACVGRILNGANAGDPPVQQPMKFELVVASGDHLGGARSDSAGNDPRPRRRSHRMRRRDLLVLYVA